LDSPPEFLNWEAISLEVVEDGLEQVFGHLGSSVKDPQVVVVGTADNRVAVAVIQPDDPVVGLNVESGAEFDFEFGVAVVCVLGVGEGFAD